MIKSFLSFLLPLTFLLFPVEKTFFAEYIYVDGLAFRQQGLKSIFDKYGPIQRSDTNYECGFHSNEEQGKIYYQLIYDQVTWIGNTEEGYIPELVVFDPEGEIKWTYFQEIEFSGKSAQNEVENFMEKKAEPIQIYGRDEEGLYSLGGRFTNADDGFFFLFKNGKLIEFHYWSPC
ncbi:hypothetical protein E4S40_16340 [Algoriphagus kandeliae]|uniref:Uncharacterized protein n=1 Tax=Algoriphagus kandeliae TaxID=2562278 RepID=A0A4Y9QJM4_9BACT|nr:hypothetical protein [Algoriphagus kandeliae]TFV92410.1 hypothetical protein E4S40_16340 [Algoriphagus kandeliae]